MFGLVKLRARDFVLQHLNPHHDLLLCTGLSPQLTNFLLQLGKLRLFLVQHRDQRRYRTLRRDLPDRMRHNGRKAGVVLNHTVLANPKPKVRDVPLPHCSPARP